MNSHYDEICNPKLHAQKNNHIGLKHSPGKGVLESIKEIWRGFRTENAVFIVLCIYLIFEYNRPQAMYPAINIIPWAQTLILISIVLGLMDKTVKAPPASAVWPILGFSLVVLISMIFAYSPSVAFSNWIDFFGWAVVVLLITSVVNTRNRLFLFMCIYFLVNLKMAQHGFKAWVGRGFSFSGWGVGGSPGWFQNSGEFSLQMAVLLPMLLAYIGAYRSSWSRGVRYFFYLFVIMAIGSIIASSSRGGVLGLVVVGIWALSFSNKKIKALTVTCVAALIIYLSMPAEFKERFETAGEDQTSVSRLTYWEYGREVMKDNPWTGIGFRNWQAWIIMNNPELTSNYYNYKEAEVIHNTYLEAGTELGIPGLLLYATILIQIFFLNLKTIRLSRRYELTFSKSTAYGLNGSLIVYTVPSFFMSVLYYPFVWLLLALTISNYIICKNESIENFSEQTTHKFETKTYG